MIRIGTVIFMAICSISQTAAALTQEELNAWNGDLDAVMSDFLPQELTLVGETREKFVAAIEALRADLPKLTSSEAVVGLCQAIAIPQNGHTRPYGLLTSNLVSPLPLHAWWFKDGLYIVRAKKAYTELLGGRVEKVAGHDVADVAAAVATLSYGNRTRHRFTDLQLLFSPEILAGLGLMSEPGPVTITIASPDGTVLERSVAPEALSATEQGLRDWQHLSPLLDNENGEWVHVLDGKRDDTPLYLQHPERVFWTESLSDKGIVFMQYTRSAGPEDGIGHLRMHLPGDIEADPIHSVVLDMRFNVGGDYTIMRPVFDKILRIEKLHRPKGIYVVTGPATFSAGISNTTYMKEKTGARIVGELVGDDLDFWAEGDTITLPNSKIRIGTNDGFHGYSRRPLKDYEQEHLHTDMNVDTLEPDLPAWPTFAEYLEGRDVCMEAILAELN